MEKRKMEVHHPAKLIRVLTKSMVEVEQIVGASGAQKRTFVLEQTRRHAVHSLTTDDALLATALTPAIVDSVCVVSNGLMGVNIRPEACCSGVGGCFSKCCALL